MLQNENQSDYMATTEAAGVRLVVHEQDQEPFPDTFGYSAPTGFVSSFGLKTVIYCHCVQPCTENVIETTYSAAAWPAINFNIGADCAMVLDRENFTQDSCAEYYRQNTAYIDIYYEQLNFEMLRLTADYTVVNQFIEQIHTRAH